MFNYYCLNPIAQVGLNDFTSDFEKTDEVNHAEGILVRSAVMHDMQFDEKLLCIARVMLCLPPMLILDEATSSIDTRTEIKIQEAFARMMKGRTSFIVATYSLHHLTDAQKIDFLRALLPLLKQDGCIFIGDVAFRTREELEACRTAAGKDWDSDEIYFVYGELRPHFPTLTFESFSHCTALLTLRK